MKDKSEFRVEIYMVEFIVNVIAEIADFLIDTWISRIIYRKMVTIQTEFVSIT